MLGDPPTSEESQRMPEHFDYAIDRRYLPLLLMFGFKRHTDEVTLTDETLAATFGFFNVKTTRDNITGAHITRDYRWWTAGGARLSMADHGLTFGTNRSAGVCVHFRKPVPSPLRRKGHPALTVTVADLDGLVRSLQPAPSGQP